VIYEKLSARNRAFTQISLILFKTLFALLSESRIYQRIANCKLRRTNCERTNRE